MLTCTNAMKAISQTGCTVNICRSLKFKTTLLKISLISTIGLVVFFLEHRLLCHRMGKNNVIYISLLFFTVDMIEFSSTVQVNTTHKFRSVSGLKPEKK